MLVKTMFQEIDMSRDVLGWRAKFAAIGPSTNTVVQPDFEAMRDTLLPKLLSGELSTTGETK